MSDFLWQVLFRGVESSLAQNCQSYSASANFRCKGVWEGFYYNAIFFIIVGLFSLWCITMWFFQYAWPYLLFPSPYLPRWHLYLPTLKFQLLRTDLSKHYLKWSDVFYLLWIDHSTKLLAGMTGLWWNLKLCCDMLDRKTNWNQRQASNASKHQ